MLGKKLLLGLGILGAGVVAMLAGTKKSSAAQQPAGQQQPPVPPPQQQPPGPPPGGLIPPAEILSEIATAAASGDPAKMDQAASDLDSKGYHQQAADLRNMAAMLRQGQQQPPQPSQQPPAQQGMTLDQANALAANAVASRNRQTMLDAAAKLDASGYPLQASGVRTAIQLLAAVPVPPPQQPPQQQPPAPPSPVPPPQQQSQYVDGSSWQIMWLDGSTGTSHLNDPSGIDWAVIATSVRPNGTVANGLPGADFTLIDGRVVRNPVKSPSYYVKSGLGNIPVPNFPPVQPPAPFPVPPVQPPAPPAGGSNAVLANSVVTSVKSQAKGSASQLATIGNFQKAEHLTRQDGKYGSETAEALADRYKITPPMPLYWGPANGTYAQYLADKKAYKAHLQSIGMTAAANAVTLSGDMFGADDLREHQYIVESALARNDPAELTALGWTASSQGYTDVADLLLERAGAAVSLPPVTTGGKQLAAQVALNVHTNKVGHENAQLLKQLQSAHSLPATGRYDVDTALLLARYGIVPDKPRHWGTPGGGMASTTAAKRKWVSAMMAYAKADPTRAEEWAAAARV